METLGLDPVGCREYADRYEAAALESLALAREYEEIGRIGLMDAEVRLTVNQLTEVHDELQQAVRLLRTKSDEIEALDRSWNSPYVQPVAAARPASTRPVGRFTPRRSGPSSGPPSTLALRMQAGSEAAGPTTTTSVPRMSTPAAKVKVPAGAKSQATSGGGQETSGSTPTTAPKKMGPPAPAPVTNLSVPRPGNWAGVSPELFAAGKKLADTIVPGLEQTSFSDSEINDLAGWWWKTQQSDDPKDRQKLQRLVTGLSVKDRNRLELTIQYYDWYAYAEAEKRLPAEFPKVMEFLSTDTAKEMSSEQLTKEIQKRLKVTDPSTLDAIKTYLHYQVGTARHLMNAHAGWNDRLIEGWFLPTLVPEEWTPSLAQANQDSGVASADQLYRSGDALTKLLQGNVLDNYERRFITIATPITGEQSMWPLAILAGIVVAGLVALALPEAAAIAALTALFGGTAAAGVAATVIVVACTGAIAGVSAKVAENFVLALAGEKEWDDVIDAGELGREALLGGMLSIAGYGIGRAIGKGLAARAASKALKGKQQAELAELTAKLAKQNADNAGLEKKIAKLKEKLAKTEAEIAKIDEEIETLKKAEAEVKKGEEELAKKQQAKWDKKAKEAKQKKSPKPDKEKAPKAEVPNVPVAPSPTVPTGEVGGTPGGLVAIVEEGASKSNALGIDIENRSARRLARRGFRVTQRPKDAGAIDANEMFRRGLNPSRDPDYLIEGKVFDSLAPEGSSPESIANGIIEKVIEKKQTRRVVLDLSRTERPISAADVINYLERNPIDGLEELMIFERDSEELFRFVPKG